MLRVHVDVSITIVMLLDPCIGIFDGVVLVGVRVIVRVGQMGLFGVITAL